MFIISTFGFGWVIKLACIKGKTSTQSRDITIIGPSSLDRKHQHYLLDTSPPPLPTTLTTFLTFMSESFVISAPKRAGEFMCIGLRA